MKNQNIHNYAVFWNPAWCTAVPPLVQSTAYLSLAPLEASEMATTKVGWWTRGTSWFLLCHLFLSHHKFCLREQKIRISAEILDFEHETPSKKLLQLVRDMYGPGCGCCGKKRSSLQSEGAATHSPGWPEPPGRAAVLAAGPGAAALSPASRPTTTWALVLCWSPSSPCTWFSVALFDRLSRRRLVGDKEYFCVKIRKNKQAQAGNTEVWDTWLFRLHTFKRKDPNELAMRTWRKFSS